MSKSLIQTVNPSPQTVEVNGIISPGSVLRRYGCDCRLSGNAVEISGTGYYKITAAVSVAPTATGPVTVAAYIMAKKDDYNHNIVERNIANAIKTTK